MSVKTDRVKKISEWNIENNLLKYFVVLTYKKI